MAWREEGNTGMKTIEDIVMFIPACGWGERMKQRGLKPYIYIFEEKECRHWMALNGVMAMAPEGMDIEVAVRREMGCPDLSKEATVHFMKETTGQANTIYNWLRRTKIRNYVLISNCDNAIDQNSIKTGIALLDRDKYKGIVYTFKPKKENDARWSYVECDQNTKILRIAEKDPISSEAVAGVYLLNMFSLRMALYPDDKYLSEALARMSGLYALRAQQYHGWNDMEQLEELEKGVPQSL
jgi:NDP-sugar pyrophosphorylase family protein